MNKILALSTILAFSSFAAAQDTTTQDMPVNPEINPLTPSGGEGELTIPPAPAGTDLPTGLSAPEYFMLSQQLAAQAEIAYPQAFVDRTLWKNAVAAAAAAAALAPDVREVQVYEAAIYSKVNWYIMAYNAWADLKQLTPAEADVAADVAGKLAYQFLASGNLDRAREVIATGLQWKNTEALQNLAGRIE